ncbi:MAG: hypothetical protein LBC56_07745 [Oscillospiraceae bacterium]|nr:hypothetical protein [Oscillospiraceae bacterium]
MAVTYTPHQKRYFAEQLTLSRPAREIEALASSMSGVRVDLNPHQVEAALFALRSPISNGALLADEVGLGKTIEKRGLCLPVLGGAKAAHFTYSACFTPNPMENGTGREVQHTMRHHRAAEAAQRRDASG